MQTTAIPNVHHAQWNIHRARGKIALASSGPILGGKAVSRHKNIRIAPRPNAGHLHFLLARLGNACASQ